MQIIKLFDKLDLLPMLEAPKHIFNTFRGYEADKLKTNDSPAGVYAPEGGYNDFTKSLIMKHIKNLCNNDELVVTILSNGSPVKCKHLQN